MIILPMGALIAQLLREANAGKQTPNSQSRPTSAR
jgi:hypothetical protein